MTLLSTKSGLGYLHMNSRARENSHIYSSPGDKSEINYMIFLSKTVTSP